MSDLKSVSASIQVPAATPADYVVSVPVEGILFYDNFASGDLSHSTNGVSWEATHNTSVSSENSRAGTNSLRFFFSGTGTTWLNSIAEQRFSTPDIPEMWLKYYIYLPDGNESYGGAAYRRTSSAESGFSALNHKLIRLWDNDFGYSSNPEKMGASTWPDNSLAKYSAEFADEPDGALLTHYHGTIFTPSDLGNWFPIVINAKIESSPGAADGSFRIWKNGSLIGEDTGISNHTLDRNHVFNFGYLFGAANHGFKEDTIIFVDEVTISASPLV